MSLGPSVIEETHARISWLLRAHRLPGGPGPGPRLLDIGCWDGARTVDYGTAVGGAELHGVEIDGEQAEHARTRGLEVSDLDLEKEKLPYPDGTFDYVVCNQVFEHLKQIFRPMNEIARTLKDGGLLVFSVPNLTSLHNRLLLLAGRQPTSIRVFGPHVRGFAGVAQEEFLTRGGVFRVRRRVGVGFYPFPMHVGGRLLGRALPGMSHTLVWVVEKVAGATFDWHAPLEDVAHQTDFS